MVCAFRKSVDGCSGLCWNGSIFNDYEMPLRPLLSLLLEWCSFVFSLGADPIVAGALAMTQQVVVGL